jgi:hypothetical protein
MQPLVGGHDPRPHLFLWCSWRCADCCCSKPIPTEILTIAYTWHQSMTNLICNSMDSWLARHPVLLPAWHGPHEPIHGKLRQTFWAQAKIRWDKLFWGWIAKEWQWLINTYYKMRQPADSYTSNQQWMRTVIKELWKLSIHKWKQQNTVLHGTDSAISFEQWRKEAANEAVAVYQNTIGKISPTDSIVLHHSHVEAIIKWNQEHLDAYLQCADIIIEQRDSFSSSCTLCLLRFERTLPRL